MGVGKKIRRILSFGRKKAEKPAIEAANVEKTNTLKGSKPKSSSLASLGRKISFGSRDKTKKERAKNGVPPAPESTNPTTVPLAAPEVVEPVVPAAVEKTVQQIETATNLAVGKTEGVTIAVEQLSETANPLFEKVNVLDKQQDSKDEKSCGDANESVEQTDSLGDGQSGKPKELEEPPQATSVSTAVEEPKTITEVINKIHDKTETNQTGNEFVRTVETEQERTLAEDGTTVISRSTKTTTTTVDRDSVGNVSQVKTEIKREVMPRVSNGHSRQISQQTVKSSNYSFLLAYGVLLAVLAFAIFFKYKDSGMFPTV